MKLLSLFIVALMPVLKVLLATAVGLLLATERVKLLGPSARNYVNNLVFYVFSPALIGSNLADTISISSIRTIWFLLVNMLLAFVIGSILGWILVKITRTPPHLKGLVIGCSSAGNLGNLPFIMLPDLCEESNSPFGDASVCATNAEAYASLSMAVLAVYMWTYIYFIIRASAAAARQSSSDINGNESSVSINVSGEISDDFTDSFIDPVLPPEDLEDYSLLEHPEGEEKSKRSFLQRIWQCCSTVTSKVNFKMVLAPSTIAAIIGLIIALITPLKNLIIGDSAPLRVIYTASALLGQPAIPCITLVVGANLLRGLSGSRVGKPILLGISAIRFIFLPIIGIVIVKGAIHLGIAGTNSLFHFMLMLQFAVPPAMNIGTISQLVKAGQSECSVIMMWTYAFAIVFLTVWSAIFMWIVT